MERTLEIGSISPHLKVDAWTIREVPFTDDEGNQNSDVVAQGHLHNFTDSQLDDVKIDISYYSQDGKFLGLDKSGFLDEDEIEAGGRIAFSITLDLPESVDKYLLNISAKKMATGVLMRWLVGGSKG